MKRFGKPLIATLICVVAFSVLAAAAPQDEERKNISAIRVEGNKRIPTETILTYVTLEAGDRLDDRIVRQDFRALWNTELFSDVEIRRVDDGSGGVVLVIRVDERPQVRSIEFEGLSAISEGDIEKKMEEPPNDLEIPEGSVLSYSRLSQLQLIINTLLEDAGLEFGEVSYELRPVEDSPFEVDVVYLVNEGGKVKIADVRFLGNESFSQWDLTRVLKKSRPTWLFSWIQKDNIYSSKLLEEDLEELRKFYAQNGFLRVAVKEPIIETIEDQPLLSGRDMRSRITIPVNEGIRYRINSITFEGNELIKDAGLARFFQLKEGDVYNKQKIDKSIENIGKLYQNQGYINAFLREQVSYPVDKKGFIDLKVLVNESEPYFVGRIDFSGNRSTRDKVLRRNVFLVEDQPFNLQSFQDSQRRLSQLGFFGSVEPDIEFDQENKVVDVTFDVTETGRNQIQFGGGYSGIEGAFFNFAFTTQNFYGQGQTLSFLLQTGDRNQNYEVSFFEPWLFDKPIGAGVTFFSRNFEFQDFVRRGDGGRANFSLRLGRFLSLFTEYRYELVEIRNPSDTPFSNSIFFPQGRTATASITPTIIRNTVDHPLLPTRGNKTTLRFEYGATFLGGDFDFYKIIGEQISNFRVTSNNILRFRVQVGWAETIGDEQQVLPVFERFFLGGENTMRGYELRTVGPRDEQDRLIGGSKSFLFNLENNFLITNELRVVPFLDGGNAFNDNVDFSNLFYSAGVELRFFVPVMNIPFRFIYAKPLNQEDFHRVSSFQFTIGSIF